MERLTRAGIRRALEALAAAMPVSSAPREVWVVGGAALVLLYGARETTKDVDAFTTLDAAGCAELRAARGSVWKLVEPYLVPGRQLKAQYAFDDLWEADRGHP